jgi:hypothetical protein
MHGGEEEHRILLRIGTAGAFVFLAGFAWKHRTMHGGEIDTQIVEIKYRCFPLPGSFRLDTQDRCMEGRKTYRLLK